MSQSLDQLVKGAPPPTTTVSSVAQASGQPLSAQNRQTGPATPAPQTPSPADPTAFLPSSPPQIYLNLLILEASLRSQYLTLRARRRQNTLILSFLMLWISYFFYGQFLRVREDGNGVGGSVYWVVDTSEKVALIGGVVMGMLFWVTGQWERGVRWPRRWLGTTNRGLRGMNLKVVVLKGPWWRELVSHLAFLFPYAAFLPTPGSSYHKVDYTAQEKRAMQSHGRRLSTQGHGKEEWMEEDVAPGGDYIKILLLSKHFTPDFRENWELYRTEYWEKENERRTDLRRRVKSRQREIARKEGGWLWWTGWRGWPQLPAGQKRMHDLENRHVHANVHNHSRGPSVSREASLREKQQRRSSLLRERETSHSRSSSRSSTATVEMLPGPADRERRWSSSTTGSIGRGRRKPMPSSTTGGPSGRTIRLTPAAPDLPKVEREREIPALSKRASNLSVQSQSSGTGSESAGFTPETTPVIKSEPAD